MRILLLFIFVLLSLGLNAQELQIKVVDSTTTEPIPGARLIFKGLRLGAVGNDDGVINVPANTPEGEQVAVISSVGYHDKELQLSFPFEENVLMIVKLRSDEELDVVIVEATRSNRTIEDIPTRTEVLTEEIDEAASMEPSKISHLITHSTGIQVQTTSATSNGAVVRIQGLNGRYTQMLKDGFPLYGGFSGSLDILQIPPLDLRQVEYIKGSASTLYGGGAIGGLINLLSKKPDADETLLHINWSHIGARDFNLYAGKRFGKWGFTNLASWHTHKAYDPDSDGYSDVPEVMKINFNPRIFFYPNDKTEFYLGGMFSLENRMGGDLTLINKGLPDLSHYYFDKQESERITTQFHVKRALNNDWKVTVKNSVSAFNRSIHIREDMLGNESKFAGKQNNSFTEFNFKKIKEKHDLIFGLNIYTDEFKERELDTSLLRDQQFFTYGLFANHLFDITDKIALESGLRFDYALAQSDYTRSSGDAFVLPRISALFKVAKPFSIRLGGGLGYRMPTVFTEEAEPLGYKNVNPIDFSMVDPERSYGGNLDFKFISDFGSDMVLLSLNQMFFYNYITSPILLSVDSTGGFSYANSPGTLHSRGFESQMKLTIWKFTWFVGYTFTDAFIDNAGITDQLILTPKHSVKGDLLFVVDGKWRIGWDYEYKSEQLLSNGLTSWSLFTTGVIVERTLQNFVLFINAENFTDTRQTRYASLLTSPNNTPQYTDIWGPLDGFFFNAGLKIKL